ncbi:hypothetical protein BWK60_05250 [Flavobacterium covae]|uniref:ADP-ribosyltransferase domain-containing protein n=1 Tax=Flavobacterium covae TaxID=2906076 RepID=UPI000B4C41CA|nr:ADP-ribosyltransferase domain-containing protein [Flavobacterium covae]OWP87139.1 hypothetical protein BWK60_05250 [Flavobacterium covae]
MKQKNIANRILTLTLLLFSSICFSQCWFTSLAQDIENGSTEFKNFINTNDEAFTSYEILYAEASALKNNVDELTLVSSKIEEIKNAGGYIKWKNATGSGSLDEMLKNSLFKTLYEPLENGSLIRKFAQFNVTSAEEASLKLFIQDNYYANFNKALAGEISMTTEYSAMKDLMMSACSKLPKQLNVTVFRGAGLTESNFAKTLIKGQKFNFNGRFTSSSIDDSTADIFRRGGNGDVIWQIESKTGVDLKVINGSESEVLFKPFTQYELIDIIPSTKTQNVLIYKIKEL